ncbi:hypothetical protein TrVFT333_006815 [Trichoderma virens FT-333]|nr:hypothetical protein TrVFT333_006815 [Trichoderma virens FT-333]
MSSFSSNTLPSLRPEHSSLRGSADPRLGQLRPSALKLEPRPVTRVKESQREVCETCEHCYEIPQTLHEAFLAREEAHLAREEARLVRDEARLAQARAQSEIRKESRQIREEMHRMCAEIYQFQQNKLHEVTSMMPSQNTSSKSSMISFPLDSPKTPNAMEGSPFVSVQEDKEVLN